MTLDPETVRRHIERALETHEHGDACEAPECCPNDTAVRSEVAANAAGAGFRANGPDPLTPHLGSARGGLSDGP